jgi:large subunit ribosomal protein L10
MRAEKQLLLDDIKQQIESSSAMVIAKYSNLTPSISWELSKQLKKSEANFEVVKKRVFIKAMKECGLPLDLKDLAGHVGIVFIENDPMAATKTTYEFSKSNNNFLEVVSGKFEGKLVSANDMQYIASLPTEKELKAQLLMTLQAPMSNLLLIMQNTLSGIVHCIKNKCEKEQS